MSIALMKRDRLRHYPWRLRAPLFREKFERLGFLPAMRLYE